MEHTEQDTTGGRGSGHAVWAAKAMWTAITRTCLMLNALMLNTVQLICRRRSTELHNEPRLGAGMPGRPIAVPADTDLWPARCTSRRAVR